MILCHFNTDLQFTMSLHYPKTRLFYHRKNITISQKDIFDSYFFVNSFMKIKNTHVFNVILTTIPGLGKRKKVFRLQFMAFITFSLHS